MAKNFSIKKYYIHRAKTQIKQWLLISAVSVVFLATFATCDALAAAYVDISGESGNLCPLGGGTICDAGTLDFEADPPSGSSGAQLYSTGEPDDFELRGWLWDTNLGWISLYCPASGVNLGVPCRPGGSTVEYGVKVNLDDQELYGWAWGDNIGWISFGCQGGQNDGSNCGTALNYESGLAIDVTASIGEFSGYAWADSVGWFDLNGINAKILDLVMAEGTGETNWGVWTKGEIIGCDPSCKPGPSTVSITLVDTGPTPENLATFLTKLGYTTEEIKMMFDNLPYELFTGLDKKQAEMMLAKLQTTGGNFEKEIVPGVVTCDPCDDGLTDEEKNMPPTKDTMPVAGGEGGYDLFVHVADITGTPVVDVPGQVDVEIITRWVDNVHLDQTVEDAGAPDDGRYAADNNGAVLKPGIAGNDLTYEATPTTGGVPNSYYGKVTSVAPTDGGNCWDGDGDGSCYTGDENYFYKNFGENIPDQTLKYDGATVTITVIPTGEVWSEAIQPLGYPGGREMEFLPIVDIPTLSFMLPGNPPIAANIIQATRNKEDVFNIQGVLNAVFSDPYVISLELEQDSPNVFYQFIETLEDVPVAAVPDPLEFINPQLPSGDYYAIPFVPDIQLADEITGAFLRSIVDLPNQGVKYHNNGLPRTDESVILNQSAEIVSGSVFSPGAKEVTTGAEVPLFGDAAVYELRTQILEDVSGLVRGFDIAGDGSELVVNSGSAAELANHALNDGRVYYFKNRDLRIRNLSVLTTVQPDRPITLIVEGGDIYVDSNIDTGNAFGLIALESRTDSNEETKGGHIYVRDNVTDMVDVSIFSDGPMFRYTNNVCFYWGVDGSGSDALRAPNFVNSAGWCSSAGSYEEPVSALPNQFYLRGNVASLNCIGCSAGLAPTRGDGKLIGGPSAENYANARLYDFNYFSYYREDPLSPGTFPGAESVTVQASATIPAAKKNLPVYFEYSPAPSDLLGFRTF